MHIRRLTSHRTVFALVGACLISAPVSAHPGSGIAVDRQGQVYFLDTGSGLWKIDTHGKLTRLSETRFHWLALDASDRFARTRLPSGPRGDFEKVGSNPTLLLSSDYPIVMGRDGNLYYPTGTPDGSQVVRMLPSGSISVLATLPATAKGPIPYRNGIAVGPEDSIYYTEDNMIRRITTKGEVSIVATVAALANGPSIPGTEQRPYLRGLAVNAQGVMYVADSGDARVLKIMPDEKATTLLQLQSPWSPTDVAIFGGDVYVLEYLHTAGDERRDWLPRVRKITADGKSTIIATVEQMPGAR